jgi:heptosyltransferase-3
MWPTFDGTSNLRLRTLAQMNMKAPDSNLQTAVKRILAVKSGDLGGVLLVTPALEALHKLFPNAEISVLIRSGAEAMVQNHPLVKRIYTGAKIGPKQSMGKKLARLRREWELVRELRAARFDLVVNFSRSDRGAILGWLSGAPQRIACSSKPRGLWRKDSLSTFVSTRRQEGLHQVEKDLFLLSDYAAATGLPDPTGELLSHKGGLRFYTAVADRRWADETWQTWHAGRRPRVVVYPTSRYLSRCWADENVAALLDRLVSEAKCAVLLTTGPAQSEMEKGRRILSLCRQPVTALFERTTLDQLGALLEAADLYVGVDTGPMHMAAAVGAKVVAIFGPSDDAVWAPWGMGHRVIRRACPCLAASRKTCNENEAPACLKALTFEEVWQAMQTALNELTAHGIPRQWIFRDVCI